MNFAIYSSEPVWMISVYRLPTDITIHAIKVFFSNKEKGCHKTRLLENSQTPVSFEFHELSPKDSKLISQRNRLEVLN